MDERFDFADKFTFKGEGFWLRGVFETGGKKVFVLAELESGEEKLIEATKDAMRQQAKIELENGTPD